MNKQFIMRPGDRFAAEECGCRFTVESGPTNEKMVRQAPVCCCGHAMKKQDAGSDSAEEREERRDTLDRAPEMAD